jgi:hypothetical protein
MGIEMKFSRITSICLFAAMLLAALPMNRAEATLVSPGERLRFSFEFPSAPSGVPDTLAFFVFMENPTGFGLPYGDTGIARLFDGTTLLAEDHFFLIRGFSPAAFVTSTSAFSLSQPSAVVPDFSSIVDGTIDGILEISFTGFDGPIDLDLGVFGIGRGFGSGIIPASPGPTITGRELVPLSVPEPSSLVLLGSALVLFPRSRRR